MVLIAVLASALAAAPQEASAPPPNETQTLEATPVAPAAAPGVAQAAIEQGLRAFKRRRFVQAEADFGKALEAEPQSAAANFYLGYTYYKIAEPTRRLTPNKQKAAALFAKAFELDPAFKPVWYRRN